MKDSLPPVRTGVDDHTVAALVHTILHGELPANDEHVPDQSRIFLGQFVNGGNVFVGHDQDVRRRYGMDVAKGGHLIIAIHDVGRSILRDDFAKHAGTGHFVEHGGDGGEPRPKA